MSSYQLTAATSWLHFLWPLPPSLLLNHRMQVLAASSRCLRLASLIGNGGEPQKLFLFWGLVSLGRLRKSRKRKENGNFLVVWVVGFWFFQETRTLYQLYSRVLSRNTELLRFKILICFLVPHLLSIQTALYYHCYYYNCCWGIFIFVVVGVERYYLVRAGESEFESMGIINTNPVAKTSVDSGLSERGKKQTVRAAFELKAMKACEGSCWIWPSITQRAYQAAEIIASVNGVTRRCVNLYWIEQKKMSVLELMCLDMKLWT